MQLASVDLPNGIDGQPFLGKGITAENVDARTEAFGHADRFDEKYDLVRTLRKGRYEYIRNFQPFNFDGLQNNYRYRMLAFEEWRELHKAGKLNAAQSQFFETRPAEQLFDLEADPHEVNDLSKDPNHAMVLADLRNRMNDRLKSMPDLSLYPESVLADQAFDNPVEFGLSHKDEIATLVDTANLGTGDFDESKAKITAALTSGNSMVRYWALIACSSHGAAAKSMAPIAKTLATHDSNGLVRVRAAEFLGLIGGADPQPVILDALKNASSGIEAGLILNTVTLLRDSKAGYDFSVTADLFEPAMLKNDTVQRRLEYLAP